MRQPQRKKILVGFIFLLLSLGFPLSVFAVDDLKISVDEEHQNSDLLDQPCTEPYPFHQFVTLGAIRLYQIVISPSKGSFCPMHPSCSRYGYQAFQEKNPAEAFLMTADRLLRCGHDLKNYQIIEVDGIVKFADSVSISTGTENLTANYSIDGKEIFRSGEEQLSGSEIFLNESVTSSIEEERLFLFAQRLELEKDYVRAITEYQRFIFYYPNSIHRGKALVYIFRCYYKAGYYLNAINWGSSILSKDLEDQDKTEIKFYIGLCYFKVGNYPMARKYFDEQITEATVWKEKSILVKGLSYVKEYNWVEAEKTFAQVPSESQFAEKARQCERLSQEGQKLKLKNPTVAGFLAVIPGLGYVYDGYNQTATSSFIVNGLFIGGTSEVFRRGDKSMGTLLGILSIGWYMGNIYGSIVSAERKNDSLKSELASQFDIGFDFSY